MRTGPALRSRSWGAVSGSLVPAGWLRSSDSPVGPQSSHPYNGNNVAAARSYGEDLRRQGM